MPTPKNRLSQYLTTKRLSINKFSEICGINKSVVSRISETTARATLRKIEESTDLNIDWLLTGDGEMLRAETKERTDDNKQYVPLIPASAFAGGVEGFAPDSIILDKCEMVVTPIPGAQYAITITGDSMEPRFPNGARAYIKRINEVAFMPWGHVVILDTENGAFIKEIYPDTDDDGFVWAKSINPKYPPLHIPKSSIYRVFRVLATAQIYTTM